MVVNLSQKDKHLTQIKWVISFLNLTTAPVNIRPTANDDSASTAPDTPVTIVILDNDSDPEGSLDLDSLSITAQPSNGKVTINDDGTITYTPNSGVTNGTDVFTYEVCDSGIPPQCDTATVTVTIPKPGNQPPVAKKQTEPSTPNNTTMPLSPLSATDDDGTVASYTIKNIPSASQGILYLGNPAEDGKTIIDGQTLSPTDISNLFFQPDENFTGNASFIFTATDDKDAVSNEALVTIYVGSLKGMSGDFVVYVGYRLPENVIIFNDFIPIRLTIANGIRVNAAGQRIPTITQFHSWVHQDKKYGNPFNTSTQEPVGFAAFIYPEPQHVGQQADILMVALRRDWGTPFDFKTEGPLWGTWKKQWVNLEASIPNVTLETVLKDIPLFEDNFHNDPGHYLIYVGYHLENGDIIYNGGEPLRLNVAPL